MGQCERLGRDGHPMTSEKPSLVASPARAMLSQDAY